MNKKEISKEIEQFATSLRLPGIKKYFQENAKEAATRDISYEEYLYGLLQKEYDLRQEHAKENRIRLANFPYKKYIEDLKIEYLPDDANRKLKVLSSLEFIKNGQNVILAGNPGTGKTHIAIGLGIKACLAGLRVLFTTIPTLINQLKESRSEKTLQTFENKFAKYDLGVHSESSIIN
ncbi:ATP-binding protein [Aceticella autotrophica]|uniref:ATP-binding protein n=1 Tax=Aceticella autotrophica TaxID=2755338 RepID=UPI002543597A|nr:ATP-binding protein [Aceticella autotrophica]